MSASEYTALVRYLVEAVWNRGDLSVLDRFVADDVVVHSYAAIPAVRRQCANRGREAGYQRTLEEISGEDDRVIVRYRAFRVPDEAPGAAIISPQPVYSGTNIYRFTGGRIAEIWVFHEGGSPNRKQTQTAPDAIDATAVAPHGPDRAALAVAPSERADVATASAAL